MMEVMVLVKSMIKNIFKYTLNSDMVVSFALNPLRWWRFQWQMETVNDMDPGLIINIRLIVGPINVLLFIDDGRY